ncbi:hypothetical protein BD408DRAFT_112359 [Parasitella parasitica]|nr:hypothetical protein BD408DRAFT_112359 [Parasitella parasitica]
MLGDVHNILLHVCSTVTHVRNNIALGTVNPSFSYGLDESYFRQCLLSQLSGYNSNQDSHNNHAATTTAATVTATTTIATAKRTTTLFANRCMLNVRSYRGIGQFSFINHVQNRE